jgi:hypothetical protein
MTDHRNDERTVKCPVEGCDATPLARGINLHIRRSSGGGHGPQGEIPDGVSLDNLETVGAREVEMDYPDERESEQVARLCPYCERPFRGSNGVLIHLGQVGGRKNHPENAGEKHTADEFPRVEVDEQGNVTAVADERGNHDVTTEKGEIPRQRVYRLIADLVAEGDTEQAHRIRKELLGFSDSPRPVRDTPPGQELYHVLLSHVTTEGEDRDVSAVVEKEGILVACGGESALYTADEALDVAAGLEKAIGDDPTDSASATLPEFLRYGSDLLESTNTGQHLHEEFEDWR